MQGVGLLIGVKVGVEVANLSEYIPHPSLASAKAEKIGDRPRVPYHTRASGGLKYRAQHNIWKTRRK